MMDEINRIEQWLKIIGTTKDGDVIDAPVTQPVMGDYWVQVEEIVITAADLLEKLACERDQWKARCEAAERDLTEFGQCGACRNHYRSDGCGANIHSYCDNGFYWRGPCEGNGGCK